MQRRNFIKHTLLAAGAISFSAFDTRAAMLAGKDTPVYPLGHAAPLKKSIMWETIGVKGSVLEKCRAVKAAGFQGVEPSSHMNREEMIAALKATGLEASSVCNSKHWSSPLSHPDAKVRQEGIDAMIVAMEDAVAYGTDAVLLVPGVVSDDVGYEDCWNRSTECIKKLLPVAKKMKVKMCLENVWNNFILSPMEAKMYIDQFNSPYVRMYFDCGNILVYGWPEQWIRTLGNRVGRIHIKEFSKQKADKEGRWAGFSAKLTEGDVNWKKVMSEVGNSYMGGWLTTEQGGADTPEGLKDLCSRLDKIMNM